MNILINEKNFEIRIDEFLDDLELRALAYNKKVKKQICHYIITADKKLCIKLTQIFRDDYKTIRVMDTIYYKDKLQSRCKNDYLRFYTVELKDYICEILHKYGYNWTDETIDTEFLSNEFFSRNNDVEQEKE